MASRRRGATAAHLAIYVVALVLGRLTVPDGGGPVFFWPAAGVAALWMLSGRTRGQVLLDGALLLTATAVADVLLGVDTVAAVLFGLANLLVGVTVRAFSAILEQRSFWGRLPRRVANPRDLAGLGAASVAAALTSAIPGLVAVHLSSGTVTWDTTYGWVVRNTCSTFVVVAAVLGLLTALFRAHARRGWDALLVPEARPHWKIELIWVAAASMLGAAVLFGSDEALPVAYLMMVASTWIGYRFSPAVGSVYTLIFSTLAVLWTQSGSGPFGPIPDLTTRAIVVQIYVMVTAVLVLLLSLGASERASLHARVTESEARATSRAELLDAVMNVMTDGLVVVEGSGEVMMRNPAAEALMGPRRKPGEDGPDDYGIFRLDGSSIERDEMPHARALHGEHVPAEDILRIDPGTGQQATLSVAALPLHRPDQDGGGTMAVVVIHDVTQERTHRRELQAFAGTVAHDLKAPLTGVGSWAEILGDQLDALEIDVSAPQVEPAPHRDLGSTDGAAHRRPAVLLAGPERDARAGLAVADRHGRAGGPRAARGVRRRTTDHRARPAGSGVRRSHPGRAAALQRHRQRGEVRRSRYDAARAHRQ